MRRTDITPKAASPSVVPAGYAPADLQSAYALPSSTAGSGQIVAVIDAMDDPHAESDLGVYRAKFGQPACTTANGCFRKVNQLGAASPLPAADQGWAGEISLDLDMVSAACPNCQILLVEAQSTSIDDLGTAVNQAVSMGARFVSNSYGGQEDAYDTTADAKYFHHPGVAITASAGDNDYDGGEYPATSANVTAVGGTSLARANNSRGWSESVWNSVSYTQGTGSGCSQYIAQPAFQAGLSTGCSNRAEADVAAVADPSTGVAVYQTYGSGGWAVYGGTSAGAPLIAATYALAGTPGSHDTPTSYPYQHPGSLNDVVTGSNGTCGAPLCTAGPGWDGPTGLGSPNGVGGFAARDVITVADPGAQRSVVGSATSLQIQAGDSASGSSMTYQATGLPAGLTIDPASGLISGTPNTSGTSSVTVTVSDATSASASVTFSWTCQPPGAVVPVDPSRILDTRSGVGAVKGAVPAAGTLSLQVAGRGGLPASGVSAVVMNVTVTQPAASGYVTVWADGSARPGVSNLNFGVGQTVPNLVVVPVGSDGRVDLFNGSSGTVQLVGDVTGYVLGGGAASTPGAVVPVDPSRILDTRSGVGAVKGAVPAAGTLSLQVAGRGGLPASGVSAVVMNVTVTQPAASGYVTVWADGSARPGVSNLNFGVGQTVPNLVVVPVGSDGRVDLFNGSSGTVQLVGDVTGYVLGGGAASTPGAVVPVDPSRILDTRSGVGAVKGAVPAAGTLSLQVAGRGGLPPSGVSAVVMNVTVTQPAASGYVTVWADGSARPGVSNLNFGVGQTVPNLVVVPVGSDGRVDLFNGSSGTVQLIGDVTGYVLS